MVILVDGTHGKIQYLDTSAYRADDELLRFYIRLASLYIIVVDDLTEKSLHTGQMIATNILSSPG